MAQNGSNACLGTTVKNTSGKARVFGFLGPRGKRLAANESFTVRGDLVATLGGQTSKRRYDALSASLDRGSLEIVKSPAVFLYDETDDRTRQLAVDNQALGTVDPCYDSSGSSIFTDGD